MSSIVLIRPVFERDATAYAEYVQKHVGESGKDGMPVFAPTAGRPSREEARDNARARWARKLIEPNWGRAWVMDAAGTGIVGHIELRGGRIPPELHRASLGMGMLRVFTRQGWGKRLIDTAVTWARAETKLAWIDLGVFMNNEPAIKLYERCGFTRQMVRKDAFRNEDGAPIDDLYMTLSLKL
jgi:RimJ/RimL family protein N-acetyltransferase